MSVMRIHKNRNYTVISNIHLRDKRMSLKAKGLLTLMLSLPEDWDYSVEGLSAICKENRTAIQSALKELEDCRYLKRTKERNRKGQFDCIYDIFEEPQEEQPAGEDLGGEAKTVKSCPTAAEKPKSENSGINPTSKWRNLDRKVMQSILLLYHGKYDGKSDVQTAKILYETADCAVRMCAEEAMSAPAQEEEPEESQSQAYG